MASNRPLHDGAPAHWHSTTTAPNFSRAVAMASHAVGVAEDALVEAMRQAYPRGASVRVVHSRGDFTAKVEGWDKFGIRIAVRNDATGKVSKWWAAHVELLDAAGVQGRCARVGEPCECAPEARSDCVSWRPSGVNASEKGRTE